MGSHTELDFAVLGPAGTPDDLVPIAASRAGAIGIVNLEFAGRSPRAKAALDRLAALGRGRAGALIDGASDALDLVLDAPGDLDVVVIANARADLLPEQLTAIRARGARSFVVAASLAAARAGEAAGADAIVAKGEETGGWVGDEGTYLLLQQCLAELRVPVWAHGGVGLHTAAACAAAGASGAVLDAQVLLARETPLDERARGCLRAMDGSETLCAGPPGARLRVYAQPGTETVEKLRGHETADPQEWRATAGPLVDWKGGLLAVGQDGAFAADLARRFVTVGGIVSALRSAAVGQCRAARRLQSFGGDAPLARSHGTRHPVVQGPMTRVSDRAEFADAVADAGALPLLALALMRGDESAALLERTAELLGDRPWGVGILGFVPAELRAEQLAAIRSHTPPFALIAGGRPDQARELEADGVATYLHVPSPGLLRLYLDDGARRFVFEGRECGGHVGPRTSFVLWDTMIRELLERVPPGGDASDYHVLFAGGVHDARSAAMVAAAAAPLAERGVRIGVLAGTVYLFTAEAVTHGAITARFQQAAIEGSGTVLLESGPGHATRCLASPFADEFEAERRRLREEGAGAEEQRRDLELLNIGRLRIAAKGADRNPDPAGEKLVEVDAEAQWERGMYMIGQVAALRDRVGSLAALHEDLSAGATAHLDALVDPETEAEAEAAPPAAAVAIVGIGSIVPGAGDARTFWANILNKVDAVGEIPETRWDWRRYFDADRAAPDKVYSRWGGFVDDVPFDPIAFGMPPNSLRSIEPFQLLALLAADAAVRDAGYADRPFARERTAVILGAGGGGADLAVGYTVRSALPALFGDAAPGLGDALGDRLPAWTEDSFPGLLMNVAAGRIANRLDLGGSNFTVDAACASSLASIALAVDELQSGTSDVAIAGGIDAIQNPFAYLCFAKTQALSPTGRCRPFDAEADGIAISEGFAAVVLKRLADAERDGDRVYAVIRGVGSASDGRDRSLTAPRPEGQMRALRRAYANAGCSPATVGLVEAHGTGTVAGDRAEVEAISAVYREAGAEPEGCAIGSVKSMIGHTKATAGVAGLIKAALGLHHKVLPPTIGVTTPNPKADFPSSPFYVNTEAQPWIHDAGKHPRRAAVSAFGFGGTNFHLVLEEYASAFLPDGEPAVDPWPAELYIFCGGSRAELAERVDVVASALEAGARPRPADLAATLAATRMPPGAGPRLAVVAESVADLQEKLARAREILSADAERVHAPDGIHFAEHGLANAGQLALLFPGQGSQAVGMGRDLAIAFPEVRESFECADRVLAGRYEQPLSRYVFPPPSFTPGEEQERQAQLTETDVAQPALGAIELGYLRLLRALGVDPEMTAGHSYGEFVALAAAGSLDETELLRLSEARGRHIREGAGEEAGAMAAIDAPPGAIASLLDGDELTLANLNAPEQTVVSGSRAAVDAAVAWCAEHDLRARRLPVACAFHSPFVAPAQERLAEELGRAAIAAPRIAVFSNTTAAPYPEEPAAVAELLGRHLIMPVEFVREIEAMHTAGARIFVEAGPRAVLSGLVSRILGDRPHVVVPIDRPGRPGVTQLLDCIATLAAEGVGVDLVRLFRGRRRERLDPRTLAPATGQDRRSPATWLVNGGSARPAGAPLTPTVPVALEGLQMTNGNGAVTNGREAAPALAPGPRGAEVMAGHQQLMQQFLETQRSVMLAYLGAPGARRAMAAPPPDGAAPPSVAQPIAALEPAPQPAPPSSNGHGPPADIRAHLLEVVSERTGYPPEMLDLDADMEADLGIDSIKRVEIAGTMAQGIELPEGAELELEELAASRTLREVVAILERLGDGAATEAARPFEEEPADERIGRYVLRATAAPEPEPAELAAGGGIVIVDDGTGVADELARRLERRGERTVRLDPADVGDPAAVAAALRGVGERIGTVKALIHLAALGPAPSDHAMTLFLLAQALRADLEDAAAAGGAAVLGATPMGGAFAIDGDTSQLDPGQGAIPGLLKTLALEWPAVRATAIDLEPGEPATLAAVIEGELFAHAATVELGYRGGERTALDLAAAPLAGRTAAAPLDARSVVLVTGGARGITAAVAARLAEQYRSTFVLVGRTQPLADEDEPTAGVTSERDLKRAIFEQRRAGDADVSPAAVEREYRRIAHGREVAQTLERMRSAGARVDYRTCDVRDSAALAALVESVYADHGRIDAVIHGAGVIEDKLVADKRPESFARVMATKAASARVLAASLRPDGLRHFVLFSSVSARFGNRGQADYGAAGEVLNKLAQDLDRRWDARVVAIDWGPWATAGMVSPEVRRQFAARGVELIDAEDGCRRAEEEIRLGRKGEAEVVIGGLAQPAAAPPHALLATGGTVARDADGGAEIVRTLDPAQDLYLADHQLDGVPVFPFAAAMELMATAAAIARPGDEVCALRAIRLLDGISIDAEPPTIRVVAHPGPDGVSVTIAPADGGRPHFTATVEFGDSAAPAAEPAALTELPPFPMPVDDAYDAYLFHGPRFQGITAIEGMDERGASALLRPSSPVDCLRGVDAEGPTWLLDPVLVDCALQMQVVWARVHWDVTLLPAQIQGYRRFAPLPAPSARVRHELRIAGASRSPICVADHWFYGTDGALLATLTGVQGVGTRALNRLAGVTA